MRILIADDVPMQARELFDFVHATWPDWQVEMAADGLEILRMVEKAPADIVLSDIRMPKMDGFAMLSAIRSISPDTKVVFITAYPQFEYARQAIRLGAADFLLKPVDRNELYDVIVRLSNGGAAEDAFGDIIPTWLSRGSVIEPAAQKRICDIFDRGFIACVSLAKGCDESKIHLLKNTLQSICAFAIHEAKMYDHCWALVCTGSESDRQQFINALVNVQLRFAFRTGISEYSEKLWKDGARLWNIAREGSEIAFYESNGIVCANNRYESRKAERTDAHKFLLDMGSTSDVREMLRLRFHELIKTRPDVAMLMEDTRQLIRDCCRLTGLNEMPEKQFEKVLFFNEYCACMENCVSRLKKQYEQSMENESPVDTAIGYIRNHYMEEITLPEMAKRIQLSPNYFSTIFRKQTSMRFMEYVLKIRLEKAAQMLLETDMLVYEIAHACGYEDEHYFSRAFQKSYGMTPANFRRSFRDE